jgi:cytochrome b involved in lipid metabolism
MTDDQLIEQYFKLDAYVSRREEILKEELKAYNEGITTIKNALMQRLIERGANHTATDTGTAYLSDILNVKVTDRAAFLKYALNGGEDMLLASAQKDAVKTYMQIHPGENPPGVETSVFTKLNIRRS